MSNRFESISSPQHCKAFHDGVANEMVGSRHVSNALRRIAG